MGKTLLALAALLGAYLLLEDRHGIRSSGFSSGGSGGAGFSEMANAPRSVGAAAVGAVGGN